MGKRNYDQDELLIRQALEAELPKNFTIIEGARTKMKLKKSFVIVLITVSLMFVTVSAAYQMGAFERLTALIGQERADELTPLEIVNMPQAAHPNTIAIELVAIEVTADVAYIYFTMQDLIAGRLDNEFFISHSLIPTEPIDDFMVTANAPEIIHRDDNGTVTFRSRFAYSHTLEGIELTYIIREVRFNDVAHPLQVVDINLAELATAAPTALLRTNSPALGASGTGSEIITSRYAEKIMGDGLPVLAPHMIDHDLALAGVQAYISSVGVVSDRLHIQVYLPDMRSSSVTLEMLHKSDATKLEADDIMQRVVQSLFVTQFGMLEDGTLGRDSFVASTHFESIYEVDLDNIGEYVLVVSGFGTERIEIDWSVVFSVGDCN